MGAILDTLIKVAKATVPEWKKTFFESGKTGYLKFIIFSYYGKIS